MKKELIYLNTSIQHHNILTTINEFVEKNIAVSNDLSTDAFLAINSIFTDDFHVLRIIILSKITICFSL